MNDIIDAICSQVEARYRPEKIMIVYRDKKFFVCANASYNVIEALSEIEFFRKHYDIIKASPYYTFFMAYILGDNSEG